MPPDVTSVALIICQKIETADSGICSAIGIADVYRLDDDPALIHALLIIKTEPNADPNLEHKLQVFLLNPEGLSRRLSHGNEIVKYFSSLPIPGIHGGITVTIDLQLDGSPAGIYMLYVLLDGEAAAKAPIMLLPAVNEAQSLG